MKVAIGADHGGFELKEALIEYLRGQNHEVTNLGTSSKQPVDYPDYAKVVAEAVASGRIERGIMIDGAGIGSAMVANKIPGVRAAMAYDLSTARNAREHNDANLLTLGAGLIGPNLAKQIVDVFLTTDCVEPRHQERVAKITAIEEGRLPTPAPEALSDTDMQRIVARLEQMIGAVPMAGPGVTGSPETARQFIEMGVGGLSLNAESAATVPDDIARYIDHTILKPNATRDEVLQVCAEAREHNFRSVCVNPCWIKTVVDTLRGTDVLTCSVVGFPLGANTPEIKAMEARRAIREGAKEIDTVVNIGALKSGDDDLVLKDIRAVTEACRDGSAVCKVIIETALLDDDEKRRVCQLARKARAHFVKTSTGFASGGATVEDVALMASIVRDAGMEVKAAGGIKTYDDARKMIAAGATRIGASASIAIVEEAQEVTVSA